MKEGWKYYKIKDIGTVIGGTTPDTHNEEYWGGDNCWISPAELKGNHYLFDSVKKITDKAVKEKNLKLLPEGTVILSSRAPIGKVTINKIPTYCNQGFKCVVCGEKVYNEFLYWWLWGNTEYLNSLGTGATFAEISKKVVEEITIPVPTLSDQHRIVSYLDTSFAQIDALAKQAEESLENAKSLFQATLEDLISEDKINSIMSLEEISYDMYRGAGIKRDQVTEDGIPCVRYGEIYTSYNYHFDKCKSFTNEDIISPKKYFEHGDILFAITGESVEEIGKSIAYMGYEKCLSGGDIVVMKHSQNPRYISYALSTKSSIKQKGLGKTKLKVVHTNVPSLKAIRMPIPSLEEQEQIATTLDTLSEKISQLQTNYTQTLANCQALKQALLRETFE